jgi:hypothetical protein
MQFLTVVVVPAESHDAVAAITLLMAPYDVERSVAARKEYVPQEALDYLVEVYGPYGLNRDDADAVVAELEEDTGFVCGHDEGGTWWMTTDNPQGKWDGWRLQSLQDDSWPATAALPEHLYPAAIVTPDGVWHDLGARWDMSDEQAQALRARAAELLAQYPSHCAVAVHCHR